MFNDDPSLTIVNIIFNKMFFFQKLSFFTKAIVYKNNRIKNGKRKSFFKKTIVIRFLKVQNEWVVFKNDRFFPKTKPSFLKTIEKRNKKRLTTYIHSMKASLSL